MGYEKTSYAKRARVKNMEDTFLEGPETYVRSAHKDADEAKKHADEMYKSTEKRGAT